MRHGPDYKAHVNEVNDGSLRGTMKEYWEIGRVLAYGGRYEIRLQTDDAAILNHVSRVLKNQLEGSGKQYRLVCRCETGALSFIRWLLS